MKQDCSEIAKKPDGDVAEPIAIIGLSCFFPGAGSLAGYWSAIRHCRDSISDIPADHWSTADYYDPDPKAEDKTYGRRGGFLDKIPFEPLKYGIVPNDLPAIDTTQLLGLVAADRALIDAGYEAGGEYDHGRTAVMLGVTGALKMVVSLGSRLAHPQLKRALADSGVDEELSAEILKRFGAEFTEWQDNSFPGLLGNVTAGRIANRLNLGGANLVVDAACASSLAAIRQGVMELQSGQADLVVSGGVDTFSDPFMYTCFSKTPALSPTGDVKAYDQEGDGTMLGEGVGVVVLKRLSDARRDEDRIFAVIRSVGSSSDGKGTAIFAPSADGQVKALENAYHSAGLSPATVELVEGHGTGTAVGDAVEVEALSRVFRESGRGESGQPWCALGSVKSQIGHTKAAAGVAGLIKAALALHFKVLPPTIKVKKPLSLLTSGKSPFHLSSFARPWLSHGVRRAGVSAFGFGGSNFHCVLEEASHRKALPEGSTDIDLFAYSGPSHSNLASALEQLLKREDHLADLAVHSRRTFSAAHPCRLILAAPAGQVTELARKALNVVAGLDVKEKDIPEGVYFSSAQPFKGGFGFLCPGPESAAKGMFLELATDWPEMIEALSEAEAELKTRAPELSPLGLALYPPDLAAREFRAAWSADFKDQRLKMAATLAVNQGLSRILARFGLKPSATIGLCGPDSALDGPINVVQELNRKSNQSISLWLEVGPGRALSQAAAKTAGRVLALDQTGGGHLDLARFLARLASWGLPVDFSAWPAPALSSPPESKENAARTFTVMVSGANQFVKKEIPPSPRRANRPAEPAPAPVPVQVAPSAPPEKTVADVLESMAKETARLHQEFLDTQNEALRLVSRSLESGTAPALPIQAIQAAFQKAPAAIAPAPLSAGPVDSAGSEVVLKVVAQETGYPVDMLNLDMDLEADLGLDSIKKVEIMAVLSEQMPSVQGLGAETMNSASTLRDLVHLVGGPVYAAAPVSAPAFSAPAAPSASVWPVLREVVSAETGYPLEMLNPDMRLGEDLGLDSIKMVEIASLMSERVDSSAALSADSLASAQTLGDLCAALEKNFGLAPQAAPAFSSVPPAAAAPVGTVGGRSNGEEILLEVISAETGYPRDMLNLNMSLEADLGLDSIKKVEIMAALSERLPEAESLGTAEVMTGVETLADLAALVRGAGSEAPAARPSAASAPAPEPLPMPADPAPVVTAPVQSPAPKAPAGGAAALLFEVVARETGYPADMLNFDMDLESDLGLDSIRRVEIMAALSESMGDDGQSITQSALLTEARTLGDLRNILSESLPSAPVAPDPPAAPEKTETRRRGPGRPPKNSPPAFKSAPEPPEAIQTTALTAFRVDMAPLALQARAAGFGLRAGDVVHLLSDESPLADELAARLANEGLEVARAAWHEAGRLSEAPLPAGLIVVWPKADQDLGLAGTAFQVIRGAGLALSRAAERGGNPLLMGVTFMGGSFALGGPDNMDLSPASASLAGLIKTAAREWAGVRARVVDLPIDAYDTAAASFVDSIEAASAAEAPVEVGLEAPGRFAAPRLAPYKMKNIRVRHIREGQTILVTGGARGVTAAALREVARSFRPHLVIMGRTPLPPAEPYWLADLTDEGAVRQAIYERAREKPEPRELARQSRLIMHGREIRANMMAMEKSGSKVTYISGDMISPAVTVATLTEIRRNYGPIHGFIHGAGVLADGLFLDKTDEDFDLVFDTKARMAELILQELADEPLHLTAFFSSSTARFGRRGQADYAAGNETLNKLARLTALRHNCKSVSVNWGPWDGGMVDAGLKRIFEREGVGLIPLAEGARLFATLIGTPKNDPVEVVVLGPGTNLDTAF
ncbi:hypothetical protein C4J81_11150 [Deltaproteobacteria bacterium Smac51]|nr:hypothetical protein C4J81_11150 [Deltaproteobacteria bacterium Smac51]